MRAYLTDFGLARSCETGSRLTRTGQAVGTPAYMSPEQARGEVVGLGPATDVWALGCVLYELLAGRLPFAGGTVAEVIARILGSEPLAIRALRPDIPRGLDAVVAVALAKSPHGRHPSAAALAADLDRILRGERPRVRAPRRWRVGAAAAAVVLLGAGALLTRWNGPGAARETVASPADGGAEALAAQARAIRVDDPQRAASLLGQALAAAPERSEWRVERGLVLWAAGDVAEARAAWDAVPAASAAWAEARLYRGLEAMFGRDLETARRCLRDAADRPGAHVALARGGLAATAEDWGGARRALEGSPGWMAGLLRGYAMIHQTRTPVRHAIRELDAALAEGLPFAWAYACRAVGRSALDDFPGAIADCDVAVRLDPRDPVYRMNRGEFRRLHGDGAGAEADLTEALALAWPGLVPVIHVARGKVRDQAGDLPGALEDFSQALAADADDVGARYARGVVRKRLGDLVGAEADYSEVITREPRHARARNNRANLRRARGDNAGAMEDLDVSLEVEPDTPEARFNRGALRADLGETAGAREDLDAAIRFRPGYVDALLRRGHVRLAADDAPGAFDDFAEASRLAPADFAASVGLAAVHHARGEAALAREALTRAIALATDPGIAARLRALLAAWDAEAGPGGG